MLIKHNSGHFILKFEYHDCDVEHPIFVTGRQPCRKVTCGTLYDYDIESKDKRLISVGFAICNPSDVFSKSIGRKIAITRILDNLKESGFGKDDRASFWKQYFEQTHEHQRNGNGR